MKSKSLNVLALILLSAGVLLLLTAMTVPAAAREAAPQAVTDEVNSCRSCHTRLYQNYDSGNWFCLCANRNERCVACHAGDEASFDEAVAHAGLVPNPLVDPATYCGQCHPQDYSARVEQFVAMTGAQPPALAVHYEYTAPEIAEPQASFLTEMRPAWQVYTGFGLALAAVITFGILCYLCRRAR